MRGFRRPALRFWRLLQGDFISTQRDQAIRWLTILIILIVACTTVAEVFLVVSRADASQSGAALAQQQPTVGKTPSPTSSPITQAPTSTPSSQSIPNFAHIFQIVLENTSSRHILGSAQAPYFNQLIKQYSLATQFYAITHPSLPNYFVMTAGTTFGVTDDCGAITPDCQQSAKNLADEIDQSGRTWVAYFESMPAPCGTVGQIPYTIHYNPFVYYTDIVTNLPRCQTHILPYNQTQFFQELRANTVPNYVWISPNLYDDMHEGYGTLARGNAWLARNVAQIIASQAFQQNGLIIITFDEGDDANFPDTSGDPCCDDGTGGGHVLTLFLSPLVKKGYQSADFSNDYSLLKTIEEAWGLPFMGRSALAGVMGQFFYSAPASGSAGADWSQQAPTPSQEPLFWSLAAHMHWRSNRKSRHTGILRDSFFRWTGVRQAGYTHQVSAGSSRLGDSMASVPSLM